jgi:hypothetical protein
MKKEELNKLDFKKFLPIVYEDIELHLMAELKRLKDELASLPDDTNKDMLLSKFENSVGKLNQIDNDESIESGIDTEEREGLCDALYAMGKIVGLSEDEEYIDRWRQW